MLERPLIVDHSGTGIKDLVKKIFGTAYKNSIIYTMILLIEKKIYKNRQKGKVTNIAEIKYELSVQLHYEQYRAEIEG